MIVKQTPLLSLVLVCLSFLTQNLQAASEPRIITLSPHLTEIVFALGAGEQIVATVEYSDYPEAATKIRTIGNSNSLSIESIVSLEPDIVLAWRTGNPELQLQRIKDLGIRIYYSKPESIHGLINEIQEIGDLIGKEAAAERLTSDMRSEVKAIGSQYSAQQAVSVFYQIWHQPLRSVGNDPWLGHLLEYCGGKNIFAHLSQAFPLVSYEAVISANPDVILVPTKSTTTEETEQWQKWSVLNAVKTQQIHKLNPDLLHRFTPRIIMGLKQLCETIDQIRSPGGNK